MPEPMPATDAQLRQVARERADRWLMETERSLQAKWDAPQAVEAAVAGIPAARQGIWRDHVRTRVRQGVDTFHRAGAARRTELADQAFAVLRDASPRLTDRELAAPSAETRRFLEGLAAGTAAGRELATGAAAADTAVTEFAGRAATLEDLHATKGAELRFVVAPLDVLVKEADEISTRLPDIAKYALYTMEDELAARDNGRAALAAADAAGHVADGAVHEALAKTAEEQHQAMVAPFDRARAAILEAVERLAPMPAAMRKKMGMWTVRFAGTGKYRIDADDFEPLLENFGPSAMKALLMCGSDNARHAVFVLGGRNGDDPLRQFCDRIPRDSSPELLAWAFDNLGNR